MCRLRIPLFFAIWVCLVGCSVTVAEHEQVPWTVGSVSPSQVGPGAAFSVLGLSMTLGAHPILFALAFPSLVVKCGAGRILALKISILILSSQCMCGVGEILPGCGGNIISPKHCRACYVPWVNSCET